MRLPGQRLRRPPFLAPALVLLFVGVLMLLAELQSPSAVLWTGVSVRGYSTGGITYYSFHGVNATLDNPHQAASDTRQIPTTVYLDPDHPADSSRARLDGVTRWLDGGLVGIWFVAAGALVAVGYVRRAARARRREHAVLRGESFGHGLDPDVVRESLRRRDRGS